MNLHVFTPSLCIAFFIFMSFRKQKVFILIVYLFIDLPFCKWCEIRVELFCFCFLTCGYLIQYHLWKRLSFPHWIVLGSCQNFIWSYEWIWFCILFHLISLLLFMQYHIVLILRSAFCPVRLNVSWFNFSFS